MAHTETGSLWSRLTAALWGHAPTRALLSCPPPAGRKVPDGPTGLPRFLLCTVHCTFPPGSPSPEHRTWNASPHPGCQLSLHPRQLVFRGIWPEDSCCLIHSCHEPRSKSQTIYFSVDGDLGSFQLGADKSKIQPGKFSLMCVLIPWLHTSKQRPKLRHRGEDRDAVTQKECFQPSLLL